MSKKLVIVAGVLLLVLLAAGCGGSDKTSSSDKVDKGVTAVATAKVAPTSKTPTEEATSGGSLKDAFEPLSLLTGQMFGSQSAGEQVATQADPDLAALLLVESDLPSGYASAGGDMGYSVDSAQGQMTMAMRTFMQGDPSAAEMGPIVISGAIAMPASAFDNFDSSLDQLDQVSAQDLQDAMGATEALGITFKDISAKKLSDVGEGGFSMHMVMDMSGLVEGLGGSDAAGQMGAFQNGIAFDMYAFKQGERLLMVMVMSAAGQESPVDGLALAKVMESRAQ